MEIDKQTITKIAVKAIHNKVSEFINDNYRSPLNNLITEVIEEKSDKFKNIIREMLDGALDGKEFKRIVKDEFTHKVAKNLVAKLEGTVEKAVDKIRQDETLRARMILAIEKLITNTN